MSCYLQECYKDPNPKKLKFHDVFSLKFIPFLLLLYFLIFLGFNIFYTSFPIRIISGLGWTVSETGVFFAVLEWHDGFGPRSNLT
jgi:MFS transporter, DHA1 family, tetracycline resistance protein